jgi:hypothetical protein
MELGAPIGGKKMRAFFLALATSATVFAGGLTQAAAEEYRYCLQGEEFGGTGDCSFMSYQQCQATASGRMASCGANAQFSSLLLTTPLRRHHR